ncbi:universal stress protein [Methylovirgula sp. 4M-Z18]|uniref:universal stress protein n=1 Tax=Methylovirgula sp. 4M-Z18 TaxID=2293567 RepID=UPI00403F6AFC
MNAKITVLTMIEPGSLFAVDTRRLRESRKECENYLHAQALRILDRAKEKAKSWGVPCTVIRVKNADPYKVIIDTGEKCLCNLIAMASHGRSGVSGLMIGRQTARLLTCSKIPVLVFR